MIFSLFNYAMAIFLVAFGFWVRFRVSESVNSRSIFLFCQASALVALTSGISYAAALGEAVGIAVFFLRLSTLAAIATILLVALLTLSFPYEKERRWLNFLAIAIWAFAAYFVLFTENYITGFEGSIRVLGPIYNIITISAFIVGILSAVLLLIRRLFFKSMIFRLQTAIVALGLAFGYTIFILMDMVFPLRFGWQWAWAVMPAGLFIQSIALAFGLTITRLFDVKAAAASTASFVLFSIILGLAAGLGFGLVAYPLLNEARWLAVLIAIVIFFVIAGTARFIRNRFSRLLQGRGAYAEHLEDELANIDFSLGRDSVIERFLSILGETINCASVNLLVENVLGEFHNVGSSNSKDQVFERRSPGIDLLLNNDISIILKTEIITNYEYHDVKDELLAMLDGFDADALILLRENRAIIGAVLLGAKRTGGDFTNYDYDTLSRIYGKLFVVAYYLKNVAQESMVLTVDRELEYSDQIIQSIQENIDKISHPAVDIAYLTRSTRKLGGDFIDFIRINSDRFIFVIGDVAGKGLNASMSMIILKSIIRTFLKQTKDFRKLVVKTNAFIKANLPRGTFFAGVFGLFDFSNRTLYYVNCGIPNMFLLSSAYNNPVEIQGEGKVLGFIKDIEKHVSVRKASFKPGDILLVTTDGLSDAESIRGARFGKERIQRSLLENRGLPSERIVRFMSEAVDEFISQELNDDITILSVKFARP